MAQNFYSQASNFTSSLQAEVDTRTGLYKANFPIVKIAANSGTGPVQDITLSYIPLDTVNRGFGQGWGLGLSYYDKQNGLLVTANGDQYKIVENATSVLIQQNKLNNIKFEKFTDHYKLIYKTGVVEILSAPNSVNNIKVPVTIYSPLGRALQLQWNLTGAFPQLLSIQDELNTLLKITYSGFTTITVWPASIEEKIIRIIQTNQQLTSFSIVSANEDDSPVWGLKYHSIGGYDLLHEISTPSGMSETVIYTANQIKFPSSAKQSSLPRVTAHTRVPGAQQPAIRRSYSYSTNNFLGYGLSAPWSASSDYLYNIATDYLYWSEERLTDGDELIVTRRTFDNFHLLREEETVQGDCQKLTTADYYAISGATYDQQPDNFLCQKSKVVTYSNETTNGVRTETTFYEYSLDGNILSQTEPDGKVTTWEYYPAAGGKECPADPHGFCRYIKNETITPATTDFETPVKAKHYTYIDIPSAAGAQEHLQRAVVQSAVLSTADKKALIEVAQEYFTDNASPYYGRAYRKTIRKASIEGGELDCVSTEDTEWADGEIYSTRTVTYYPYDYEGDNKTSRSVQYYPLSLKEHIVTDSDGNTTEYYYDEQDRLTKSIKNKGTIYEANLNYTYQMEEVEPGTNVFSPALTVQDEKGNISKNIYDGLGNLIRQSKLINDSWIVVFSRKYDAFGRECYNDRRDQLNDIEAIVSQELHFNNWGIVQSIQYNDGHYEYNDYDPITMQSTLWHESVDDATAHTVTQYNVNGVVTSQWKVNALGQSIGVKNFHYDGLSQLRSIVDDTGVAVTYDYDAYGRVIKTTLGDGTVIRKSYATHTSEKLITHIYADDRLLGEQKFDGLGRLKESTVANRTQQFAYELDKSCPYWTLTADGQELQYEYISALGNVVKNVKDRDALILQEMTYDPVTGSLLTGINSEGIKFVNTYNNDSTLATETFTDNNRSVSTKYTFSGGGVLLDYTGVDSNNRHSTFNVLGQCLHLTDGSITLDNEFDTLGRLKKITTTDSRFSSSSVMEIHYDEFSREWTRSFSCGSQERSVEQLYYPDDSIQTRITRQNTTILLREDFTYNNRNQLYTYSATGEQLPEDKYGNKITYQVYTYDNLGNIKDITTTFTDGDNVTEYHYDLNDPCQLKRVVNSHSLYPKETILGYDLAGRMTTNETGQTLTYDVFGHLHQVISGSNVLATYHYDAMDRMVRQHAQDGNNTQLYYREGNVVSQYSSSAAASTDFVKVANTMLARTDTSDSQLYLTDFKGTPISRVDSQSKSVTDTTFTAYGETSGNTLPAWSPAFNGQIGDALTGYYHLGNGYRAYNPELMRFNTPDSWSPFGIGGINPYVYCRNDPINFVDPTGHITWQAGVSIGLGILDLILTIFTAGAAIIVEGGIMAAMASAGVATIVLGTVSVVGDIASITSEALEDKNPDVANAFSWVSKACSLISFGSVIPKVPGYIKEAPEMVLEAWSKARGKTGSYDVTRVHDTRGIMVKTADRYMKITDSTAFSVGYHVGTVGTKMGIKIYDYVSQKKEDTASGQQGSDTSMTGVTNNKLISTSDLKATATEGFYLSSTGMQTGEASSLYVSQKNSMTDALSPLYTQLKNDGVHLVNENSLMPWVSTVSTKM